MQNCLPLRGRDRKALKLYPLGFMILIRLIDTSFSVLFMIRCANDFPFLHGFFPSIFLNQFNIKLLFVFVEFELF